MDKRIKQYKDIRLSNKIINTDYLLEWMDKYEHSLSGIEVNEDFDQESIREVLSKIITAFGGEITTSKDQLKTTITSQDGQVFVLDEEYTSISKSIFQNLDCELSDIVEIQFASSVENIDADALDGMTGLTSFICAKEGNLKEIYSDSFQDCTKLKEVQLNVGLEKIGTDAFKNSIDLEYLVIPYTLKEIGKGSFGSRYISGTQFLIQCKLDIRQKDAIDSTDPDQLKDYLENTIKEDTETMTSVAFNSIIYLFSDEEPPVPSSNEEEQIENHQLLGESQERKSQFAYMTDEKTGKVKFLRKLSIEEIDDDMIVEEEIDDHGLMGANICHEIYEEVLPDIQCQYMHEPSEYTFVGAFSTEELTLEDGSTTWAATCTIKDLIKVDKHLHCRSCYVMHSWDCSNGPQEIPIVIRPSHPIVPMPQPPQPPPPCEDQCPNTPHNHEVMFPSTKPNKPVDPYGRPLFLSRKNDSMSPSLSDINTDHGCHSSMKLSDVSVGVSTPEISVGISKGYILYQPGYSFTLIHTEYAIDRDVKVAKELAYSKCIVKFWTMIEEKKKEINRGICTSKYKIYPLK